MARRRRSAPQVRVQFASERTPQVLPELAATRHDVTERGAWRVQVGAAARGEAWTNHADRVMQAPTGNDDAARAIRMHEQMHAMVSPATTYAITSARAWLETAVEHLPVDLSWVITKSCEEVRVNWLSARALAGVLDYAAALTDGSEKRSGEDAAKRSTYEAFTGAVTFGIALLGTNAFGVYVRALAKAQPEWADALREMRKVYAKRAKEWAKYADRYGSIERVSGTKQHALWSVRGGMVEVPNIIDGEVMMPTTDAAMVAARVPLGFVQTLELARDLCALIPPRPRTDGENGNAQVREANEAGSGIWQPLVFGDVELSEAIRGASVARRTTYTNAGVQFRSVQRWTTDPQRRAFGTTKRTGEAVVLFDLSGSMSLDDEQIAAMLQAAPNGTLIGYAGAPIEGVPNAWVLARNGRRVSSIEALQQRQFGNACDGVALEYALREAARMSAAAPVVWVTDGGVTDREHAFSDEAFDAAAELVIKHRVIILPDSETAVRAFKQPSSMRRMASVRHGKLRRRVPRSLGGEA